MADEGVCPTVFHRKLSSRLLHKEVGALFVTDGGAFVVTGVNGDVVGQGGQFFERLREDASVAAWQVGASAGSFEEGVAGEDDFFLLKIITDAAFGMAGSFQALELQIRNLPVLGSFGVNEFSDGFSRDWIVGGNLVLLSKGPFKIFGMNINGRGMLFVQFGEGAEVVGVAVRQEVCGDGKSIFPEHGFDISGIMAGVDDERLFCVAPDDGAVHFKGADGEDFNIHAGENRQGGRGIKARTAKMSPDCS